ARAPAAGAPRPASPRVVSAHVAPGRHLRRDRRRFPLVARCRGEMVGAAAEAAPRTACDDRAAGRPAEAPGPPPRARARLHRESVHVRLAGVPEAEPSRSEPGSDRRGTSPLRRSRRPVAAVEAGANAHRHLPSNSNNRRWQFFVAPITVAALVPAFCVLLKLT